jgi:glycerol-3-phosphate dehydrogenase (NAD(P)+)
MADIGVIGAGAWGTAFAVHLARKGIDTLLWVYESELAETLHRTHENTLYLPGFTLPANIRFTNALDAVPPSVEDIVIAAPSFAFRKVLEAISGQLSGKRVLILTKGLETDSLLRMSQVVEECASEGCRVAALSGPSFAKEVAQGLFASVVVASKDKDLASYFQRLIHNEAFRVYTSEDIIGVELGGAMKNVMAIGAGLMDGMRLGTNAQAAFTTRALAEIKRLGAALGARETTFMGLSGMGDLILTSYGNLSRNRSFGTELSRGRKPAEIIASSQVVVEGYYTIKAAYQFSCRLGIEMPITRELYRIVYEGKNVGASLKDITTREYKEEDA